MISVKKENQNDLIIVLLLSIVFTFASLLLQNGDNVKILSIQSIGLFLYIFGVFIIGLFSFTIIKNKSERFFSDNQAYLRFIIKVLGVAIIPIPLSLLYFYLYFITFLQANTSISFLLLINSNILVIAIINYSFLLMDESRYWNKKWKKTDIDKNKIMEETYRLQYENLKGHINPHFMFNSFAGLTSYIEKDKEEAIRYVEDLSDFFRNILVYKSTELISLDKEIEIAKTYFGLEQRRHKDTLKLTIEAEDKYLSFLIPPMSLQLLIENAIKHNIFNEKSPLEIRIITEDNYLRISNPFKPRDNSYSKTTKTGLNNLTNTYALFTDQEVIVDNNDETFTVKIPLIDFKE